jgi:hypothetical protein
MLAGFAAAVVALAPQFAAAENYPEKPIRFVVPYAAGGTTDLLSRAIAQKLAEAIGQPVAPDNRPSAGGNGGPVICGWRLGGDKGYDELSRSHCGGMIAAEYPL